MANVLIVFVVEDDEPLQQVEGLLARSERFELPTLGIEIRCSIQLSYERLRWLVSDLV